MKLSLIFVASQTKRQNKSIGLMSQKFCTYSTPFCTFLWRCFARLQRRPRYTTFYGRNVVRVPVRIFFHCPLIFTLVAVKTFHFRTAAIKFSCFSSKKISLLSFSSLALALSLLSTSMLTFKFNRSKDSSLLLFLSL